MASETSRGGFRGGRASPDAFLGGVHVAYHGGARVGTRVGVTRSVALLAPSAPFAVWSYAAQPLAEALDHLRKTHAVVNVSLHEPWLRKYQVLPGGRTRR